MDNQNITSKNRSEAIVKGFQDIAQTLKNTQTTVKYNDVSITITAEPMVIEIQIKPSADISKLPEQLKNCLNEAFRESSQKMMTQATKELEESIK